MKKIFIILIACLIMNFVNAFDGFKYKYYFDNSRYSEIFEDASGNKLSESLQTLAYEYIIHDLLPDEAKDVPAIFFIDSNRK